MHKIATVGDSGQGLATAVINDPSDRRSSGGRNPQSAVRTSGDVGLNIPLSASFAAECRAKLAQIKHRLRWANQQISPPDVGVIGGYHHGNLGDMAMGFAVARRIAAQHHSWGLQTVYNLQRWPDAKAAIVGGGAVGYAECLRQLAAKYGRHPERVAILGVDFNDPEALRSHARFLKQLPLITCRSAAQAKNVADALARQDVTWHPDLCFSLYRQEDENLVSERDSNRIFGINCVPLFLKKSGRRFIPGTNYLDEMKRENPKLIRHIDKLGLLYCDLVRRVCVQAKRAGFRVRHIPFTPIDDVFARVALAGSGVEFVPYTSNVTTVLAEVGECQRFFTTRFHSLVFSLLKHCTITPFCYASKCNRLLEDFGVADDSMIRLTDLLEQNDGVIERVVEGQGFHFSGDAIRCASERVTQVIDSAIAAVTTRA